MALRPLPLFLLASAAAALCACEPPHARIRHAAEQHRGPLMRVVDRLDCPERQDSLRRVRVAADGRSCDYEGANGSRVTLRILPLDGATAETALAPVEAELKARLPARTPQPAEAASEEGDEVNISMPGINIDADEGGANIRIGGLHVDADSDGANVRLDPVADTESNGADGRGPVVRRVTGRGDVSIDADDQGAEIRISAPGRDVRMTYILASSTPGPGGDRLVAYEARGPVSGPLVVATLRSQGDRNSGPIEPMKRLVRRNTGG